MFHVYMFHDFMHNMYNTRYRTFSFFYKTFQWPVPVELDIRCKRHFKTFILLCWLYLLTIVVYTMLNYTCLYSFWNLPFPIVAWRGHPCTDVNDCQDFDHVTCYDYTCKCVIGYYYSVLHDACVEGKSKS